MAIKYSTLGYNVGKIDVTTKLVAGSSVTIGDAADYDSIKEFSKTGMIRIKCTVDMGSSDADFDGVVLANQCQNGIEFATITFYDPSSTTGGSPIIIGGQVYMDGTVLKCHITATPVS